MAGPPRARRGLHGPRSGGPHVRTGCGTCKARHKKCDEERPACSNCRKTGRICDGYIRQYPTTPNDTPSLLYGKVIARSTGAISDSRSRILKTPTLKQFYEFFHCQTRPQINYAFGSSINVHQFILQSSHSDENVMHIVVAMGAVARHLNEWSSAIGQPSRSLVHAQSHYAKAISGLAVYISNGGISIELILLSCVLLILLDFIKGDSDNVIMHLTAGSNILQRNFSHVVAELMKGNDPVEVSPIITEMIRIFTVIDLYGSVWLGDFGMPSTPMLHPQLIYPDGYPHFTLPSTPTFQDLCTNILSQALRYSLFVHRISKEASTYNPASLDLIFETELYVYELCQWREAFARHLVGKVEYCEQDRIRTALIRMIYNSLAIAIPLSSPPLATVKATLPDIEIASWAILTDASSIIPVAIAEPSRPATAKVSLTSTARVSLTSSPEPGADLSALTSTLTLSTNSSDTTTYTPLDPDNSDSATPHFPLTSTITPTAESDWRKPLLRAVATNCQEPRPGDFHPFTFLLGAIYTINTVATKSTDTVARQNAIKILDEGAWREGSWDSRAVAALAKKRWEGEKLGMQAT